MSSDKSIVTGITQKIDGAKKCTNPAKATDIDALVTPAHPSKKIKTVKKSGNIPKPLRRTGTYFFLAGHRAITKNGFRNIY